MLFAAPPNGEKHQYIFVQIHSNLSVKMIFDLPYIILLAKNCARIMESHLEYSSHLFKQEGSNNLTEDGNTNSEKRSSNI